MLALDPAETRSHTVAWAWDPLTGTYGECHQQSTASMEGQCLVASHNCSSPKILLAGYQAKLVETFFASATDANEEGGSKRLKRA